MAVISSAGVHDHAPRIRALVLAAPAFRIKLYVLFAVPLLRITHSIATSVLLEVYHTATQIIIRLNRINILTDIRQEHILLI